MSQGLPGAVPTIQIALLTCDSPDSLFLFLFLVLSFSLSLSLSLSFLASEPVFFAPVRWGKLQEKRVARRSHTHLFGRIGTLTLNCSNPTLIKSLAHT